ncbi:MAG TPA: histone deacetylase [Acidimicrobiales bacterium]|nr:histone deacetylase [Acidimicrobiales bacterium]
MLVVAGPTTGHDGGGHPERPARLDAVMAGLADLHLGDQLVPVAPEPAARDDLLRVHTADYLDHLEARCRAGGGHLDPDTYLRPDSWDTALRAAGAGLAAVRALRDGRGTAAFVAARPPGHHAEPDHGMGFCLLNNVAVAAAALAADGERVLVVDWDVHHGNGTQAAFWDRPEVLFVSTHQWPLYPGTGRADDVGGPAARGLTVNVPLPPGATGDVVRRALDDVAGPVVDRFAPTWVLVSAGFDAHRADPLADLALSSADFADLARTVARPGRTVLFLEGGYDLAALRASVAATVDALVDGGRAPTEPPTSGGPGADQVRAAAAARAVALAG